MSFFRSLRDSQLAKEIQIIPTRQLMVVEPHRAIGANFNGSTLDPNFWTSTVANSGTNAQASGEVRIRTNGSANGSAKISSVRVARFVSSSFNKFRSVVQLGDTGTANNVRRWGVGDDNEGAFYQLSGTTFSVVTRKAASDTTVSSSSFNGQVTSYTVDTNAHTFEILYGSSQVRFFIDDVLIHTVNASATPWAATLNHKIMLENVNSGGSTTDVSLYVRVASVIRLGETYTRPTWYNLANANETRVLKYGPGTLHRLVFNDPSATGTLTFYDNTAGSGTVIAALDTSAFSNPATLEFMLDFNIGLTYISASGPGNITIIYD